MSCLLTSGNTIDCTESFALSGGLLKIYIANASQLTSITDSDADNIFDTIAMVALAKFYGFDFHKDGAMFTQTGETVDGGIKLKQTLTLTVPNYDQDKADLLKSFVFSKVVVIAETRSGKRFILGYGKDGIKSPLEYEAVEMASGKAQSDLIGTTYTFSSYASSAAPEFLITAAIPV